MLPSLFERPALYAGCSITLPASPHTLYKTGDLDLHAFTVGLRTESLPCPSKAYRLSLRKGSPRRVDAIALRLDATKPRPKYGFKGPKGPPTVIDPEGTPGRSVSRFPTAAAFMPLAGDGSPLCPLCLKGYPNNKHYTLHQCQDAEALSGLLRRSIA